MGEEFEAEPLKKIKVLASNPQLLETLKDKGYYTLESLAVESPHVLLERVGERLISLDMAKQIVREARGCLKVEIISAAELLELEKQKKRYTTGSKALDELLGGGVPEQEMTEFCGPYESGKTECCMTIAMLAAKDGVNTIYWDTEGGFSPGRLAKMAKARGLAPEKILPHIYYGEVYGSEHLLFLIENTHKLLKEKEIKILILDSFVSPFRAEYPGRELLAPRQQLINRCQRRLINYMRAYKLAVITTEQVLASPQAYAYESRPEILNPPVGGHVVSHAVSHRVYFQKVGRTKRLATLVASNYLPPETVAFSITERGVEDVATEE